MSIRCPTCGHENSSPGPFCPFCGSSLGETSAGHEPARLAAADGLTVTGVGVAEAETMAPSPVVSPSAHAAAPHPPAALASSDVLTPGVLVAGRYRIVALLGRGGMGEVYRADDLKLGQAVALKFLPRSVERDPSRLERFLAEVRMAREVSHPNVCRVHDVGEVDGRHFLSMEYIDGEDLAALLRRIGRLPSDKALEISRQLCAGLAAAHDRGVLHRDLKPANVMLDGRGHVRLTDFGLAESEGAGISTTSLAGTPAYMAPEQFEGQPASVATDVYALGLVLYEVFTGKRVFEANTIGDLRRLHDESRPPTLASVIRDSDPAVERVIQRCLDKDPTQRPASAIAVAAALPGGDPLAAALAAGETPSPAMVAAAGDTGGVQRGVAAAWFAAMVAGVLLVAFFATRTATLETVPKPFSQDVLAARAQEMLSRLGYPDTVSGDSAWAFEWDADYIQFVTKQERSPLAPAAQTAVSPLRFWFRSSPTWLVSQAYDGNSFGAICRVAWNDPPRELAGMRSLMLSPQARLLALEVVPPAVDAASPPPAAPFPVDWQPALAETGIDPASLSPDTPTWTPRVWSDTRMAWTAHYSDLPAVPLRVEAAAYRGKVVSVQVVGPWTRSDRAMPEPRRTADQVAEGVQVLIIVSLLVGGALVARRNVALGRGDLRGASRVAATIAVIFALRWLLATHHVGDFNELVLLFKGLGATCLMAAWMWVLYVGLEPFVRRRWPRTLIGWSRLLMGRFSDPLVGRDVMVGITGGLALSIVSLLGSLITGAGAGSGLARFGLLTPLAGVRGIADLFARSLFQATLNSLGLMFLLFLLRIALRRDWLMAVAFVMLMSTRIAGGHVETALISLAFEVASALLMVILLARVGLLAFAAAWIVDQLLELTPMTTHLWAWHSAPTIAVLVALIGLAVMATRIALAGQSLMGTQLGGD